MLQLQDITLDEVCLSDDLIVPRPSCEHANEFLSRIDNCKKPWYEVIGLLRTIGGQSTLKYNNQQKGKEVPPLNKDNVGEGLRG